MFIDEFFSFFWPDPYNKWGTFGIYPWPDDIIVSVYLISVLNVSSHSVPSQTS